MTVWVMAKLTFREAARRWIIWVALLLGMLFLGVYGIGFNEIHKDILRQSSGNQVMSGEIYNFLLQAGLYVVNFLTMIMGVLTSVDTLSGEISSGTVHTLVSKPVRRWQILIGKWVGYLGMLTLYLLLMAGGVIMITRGIGGYTTPNPLSGLILMWLNVALVLCLTFWGGAALSTLANGAMVFGLYGVAFIGGWIEQFGSFLKNTAAINVGIVSSLIFPAEALWRRAAFEMQSPLVKSLGGFSPLTSVSVPSPLMVIYSVLYAVVALGWAIYIFDRRDL